MRTSAVHSDMLYESAAESCVTNEMSCDRDIWWCDMYVMMPFHIQAGSAPLEAQRQIPFSLEAQM